MRIDLLLEIIDALFILVYAGICRGKIDVEDKLFVQAGVGRNMNLDGTNEVIFIAVFMGWL